ncbi:tetratricopeptide repeat protein [Methylomonas sp. 11b]|uniref:tetratricopeptide repeat protein n=1 Tax=Methylomonas sp. 11b TaxID=1168169 RepID=UPI0012DDDF87|nr:SEL1-like repeat protein [Methylomonas sp. 11b]
MSRNIFNTLRAFPHKGSVSRVGSLALAAILCSACQPNHMGLDTPADIATENCYAYRYGDKLRKINFAQAFDWCHRAADSGDANSQALLGELYYLGLGGPQDMTLAARWFEAAARQGHAHAQYMLYRVHATSPNLEQQEKADYWLNQARHSGYKLALPAQ